MQKASKKQRLIQALLAGQDFTAGQIKARFKIANPTATISDIRLTDGIPVFANTATKADGTKITVYRTGKAPRHVVAAGYRALAMGLVA
jgi:hypothetical protein